jgi:hypothetical protein
MARSQTFATQVLRKWIKPRSSEIDLQQSKEKSYKAVITNNQSLPGSHPYLL